MRKAGKKKKEKRNGHLFCRRPPQTSTIPTLAFNVGITQGHCGRWAWAEERTAWVARVVHI